MKKKLKQSAIGKIPKDWKVTKLGEIALDFISGGTPSTKNAGYWDGNIPWMTSAHIEGKSVCNGMKYITEEGLNKSATKIIPKNSILVASRVGIGKIAINLVDIAISQDLTGIVLNAKHVDVDFLYWLLSNYTVRLKTMAQGSTIKGLLRKELEKFEISLPPFPEQRKIAEILGTVDEVIEKVDQAIEKTERLKKGLMQELLTRGIGHREFKDTEIGRIPKEWEVVRLDRVIKEMGNGFASGERDDNGIVQIRMNNVTTDGKLIFDKFIKVPKPDNVDTWTLQAGDFLFNNTNSYDLVGKSTVFEDTPFPCTFSNHFTRIEFDNNKVNPYYILYHFIIFWQKGYFKSIAIRHVGQSAVHSRWLQKLTIPLPQKNEQDHIVEIIDSTENNIVKLDEKRQVFDKIKKGLMNDLLTGKKRVKV